MPLGTAAHYGFLRQMDHFGVDVSSLQIVDMAPPEGAAALSQGAVDFACGWGGGLARMKEYGNILLTGAEKQELGILVFDVTSAPASYIAENGDTDLRSFVKVTADANAEWAANQSDEMLAVIAKESGMDVDATKASISTFEFPTIEEQLSRRMVWRQRGTLHERCCGCVCRSGSIDSALDSYEGTVNTGPSAKLHKACNLEGAGVAFRGPHLPFLANDRSDAGKTLPFNGAMNWRTESQGQ